MPRFLHSSVIVDPSTITEYTTTPTSAYDQTGYAHNIFPERYSPPFLDTFLGEQVPPPYGIPR
jgi:hypothetical protein